MTSSRRPMPSRCAGKWPFKDRSGRSAVIRHKNRPGVLAKVFDVLSQADINVEEMDNILYAGAEAACARIQLGQVPNAQHLEQIRMSTPDILSVELKEPAHP